MTTARRIAVIATAAVVILAVIPGALTLLTGKGVAYDANVAVLTATAIAIIWYTSFTYESTDATRRMAEIMSRDAFRNVGEDAEKLQRDLGYLRSRIQNVAQSDPSTFALSAARKQLRPPFKQAEVQEARGLARGLPAPLRREIFRSLQEVQQVTSARSALVRSAEEGKPPAGKCAAYQQAADRAQKALGSAIERLQEVTTAASPQEMDGAE